MTVPYICTIWLGTAAVLCCRATPAPCSASRTEGLTESLPAAQQTAPSSCVSAHDVVELICMPTYLAVPSWLSPFPCIRSGPMKTCVAPSRIFWQLQQRIFIEPAFVASAGDASTGRCIATLQHESAVDSCSFSPDGTTLATSAANFCLVLWQPSTGVRRATLPLDRRCNSRGLSFSPLQPKILAAASGHAIRIVDTQTCNVMTDLQHNGPVAAVAFAPAGDKLASAVFGTVWVWDTRTGASRVLTEPLNGMIGCLAWSPYGSRLVSGGADCCVQVWDVDRGECVAKLRGLQNAPVVGVACSACQRGNVLPAGDNATVVAFASQDQTINISCF